MCSLVLSDESDDTGEEFPGGARLFRVEILYALAEQNSGNDFPRQPWATFFLEFAHTRT